jgi:hypothetical protein
MIGNDTPNNLPKIHTGFIKILIKKFYTFKLSPT